MLERSLLINDPLVDDSHSIGQVCPDGSVKDLDISHNGLVKWTLQLAQFVIEALSRDVQGLLVGSGDVYISLLEGLDSLLQLNDRFGNEGSIGKLWQCLIKSPEFPFELGDLPFLLIDCFDQCAYFFDLSCQVLAGVVHFFIQSINFPYQLFRWDSCEIGLDVLDLSLYASNIIVDHQDKSCFLLGHSMSKVSSLPCHLTIKGRGQWGTHSSDVGGQSSLGSVDVRVDDVHDGILLAHEFGIDLGHRVVDVLVNLSVQLSGVSSDESHQLSLLSVDGVAESGVLVG